MNGNIIYYAYRDEIIDFGEEKITEDDMVKVTQRIKSPWRKSEEDAIAYCKNLGSAYGFNTYHERHSFTIWNLWQRMYRVEMKASICFARQCGTLDDFSIAKAKLDDRTEILNHRIIESIDDAISRQSFSYKIKLIGLISFIFLFATSLFKGIY